MIIEKEISDFLIKVYVDDGNHVQIRIYTIGGSEVCKLVGIDYRQLTFLADTLTKVRELLD